MPPRRPQPAEQQDGDGAAGPSQRGAVTFADYVSFTVGQAVISEGCLPEAEVKAMIRRLTQRNSDDAFRPVLTKVQQDVSFLELSVERIKFPLNDQWYVCLVDKEKDDASKLMGAKYGLEQVQYFGAVVDAICRLTPPAGSLLSRVSEITLKNLDVQREANQAGTQAAKARKLSLVDKEGALRALARDAWLHQPEHGYYMLGPRSLAELKDWVLSLVPADIAEQLQAHYI